MRWFTTVRYGRHFSATSSIRCLVACVSGKSSASATCVCICTQSIPHEWMRRVKIECAVGLRVEKFYCTHHRRVIMSHAKRYAWVVSQMALMDVCLARQRDTHEKDDLRKCQTISWNAKCIHTISACSLSLSLSHTHTHTNTLVWAGAEPWRREDKLNKSRSAIRTVKSP